VIDPTDPIADLRARAEARLRRDFEGADVDALAGVVHELEVHKAELQIQNEELRRAKHELEGARDRYFALYDRAPIGFVTLDERGLVKAANRVAGEVLAASSLDLVGRPFSSCFPAAGAAAVRRYATGLFRSDACEARELEVSRPTPDGQLCWLHLQGRIQTSGDKAEAWIVLNDVTTQRAAEAALAEERDFAERLLDVAPVIALVIDLDGKIVRFNRFMEETCGYSLAEVRGADWFETFLPGRCREETKALFAGALDGERTRGHVNAILTRSGQERLVEWSDTPILGSDGVQTGILAIGRDITESRQLEENIRHAQKMEAVGTLAAGVAHDFNNMLMGMVGVLDLAIKRAHEEARVRPLLQMIRELAQAGTATVSQLMAFSRRASVEPVEQPFDPAVREVVSMLSVMLGEDVVLSVNLRARGARVRLGRGQIEQIVTNLAVNSRHAMPQGGRLSIRTSLVVFEPHEVRPDMAPGTYVRLEVEDTGLGMDEATRRRVFEPFFTTKDEHEGTGLGLSTVYGMVRSAGGTVDVESTPAKGTLVRVDFPRVRDSQTGLEAQPLVSLRGNGETILLVEDEAIVRLAVRHYLEEGGYRVLEASNSSIALDLFGDPANDVDLVLSDVVLPGVQGPELAARMRERVPGLRVVWMSAHPAGLLRAQGRIDPSASVLQKPFGETELLSAVAEALRARSG
jgi:PAS domain S-box-containing protein